MSLSNKRPNWGTVLSIIIILIILCYFAAFALINFAGFAQFNTMDMYEDTLIARLMWEQKTLFPENYLFGNQFYVIATPVLAALFYGICGSMNTAMALATTVMSALILVSLNWMLKPFVKQACYRYGALLVLLTSVFGPNTLIREDGQLFFVMCSYYACYTIVFFYLMGDYARAREDESLRPAAFTLALLLSFCTGMQSLRQTCVSILPILCFEFLSAFYRLLKRQPLWPRAKRMSLIRAAGYFIANVAGLLFIKLLGVGRNEIYYGQSIFSGASVRDKIKDVHNALVTVSGFDFTRAGYDGFFVVLFLFLTLIVIAAAIIILRGRNRSPALAVFWWLCLISIAAVIAASFVTSVSLRPIYLFPYYTLPALSMMLVLHRLREKYKNIICALLCVLAFANIYYSYHVELDKTINKEENVYAQMADFAMENGYELIYGAHSYAATKIAAQSDGRLIAGCWDDDVIFKLSPHINIKDIYYSDDYSRALYVFSDIEEELAKLEAEANGTELYFQGRYGEYSLYTSSQQLMYPRTEFIHNKPEYN